MTLMNPDRGRDNRLIRCPQAERNRKRCATGSANEARSPSGVQRELMRTGISNDTHQGVEIESSIRHSRSPARCPAVSDSPPDRGRDNRLIRCPQAERNRKGNRRDLRVRCRDRLDSICPTLEFQFPFRCRRLGRPSGSLQRALRSIGKIEGDEPTWIVSTISKPCLR